MGVRITVEPEPAASALTERQLLPDWVLVDRFGCPGHIAVSLERTTFVNAGLARETLLRRAQKERRT
jgi:hypothetical protein